MQAQKEYRAVATIIGGVLLAIALLALISLYFYLNTQQKQLINTISKAAEERLTAQLLASSVTSHYSYNSSTHTLTISMLSTAPRALTITSINILWANQTILSLDRYTNTSKDITLVITPPSSTAAYAARLPATLGPGDKLTVIITHAQEPPITISATISVGTVTAIVPVKPAEQNTA